MMHRYIPRFPKLRRLLRHTRYTCTTSYLRTVRTNASRNSKFHTVSESSQPLRTRPKECRIFVGNFGNVIEEQRTVICEKFGIDLRVHRPYISFVGGPSESKFVAEFVKSILSDAEFTRHSYYIGRSSDNLLGKNASTISKIETRYNVYIHVDGGCATISGSCSEVGKARRSFEKTMLNFSEMQKTSVDIGPYQRYLLGHNDRNIQVIKQKCDVFIKIDGERAIISGGTDGIAEAESLIQNHLNEFNLYETKSMYLP
eukprot:719289_1